ncbi:hypothetical protein BsWGS_11857 [Bradybaena similaris]
MFTLISRVVKFFLEEKQATNHTPAQLPSDHADDTNCSAIEFSWLIKNTDNAAVRSFQGSVTHMFQNHGLIDGDVYFSVSDVHFDDKLQIGDKVLVKAAQQHKDGGWYAENIVVIKNTWDQEKQQEPLEIDLDILQSRVVLGKVSFLQDAVGQIDANVTFDVVDCKDGYVPVIGDWVSANVVEEMVENIQEDEWSDSSHVKVRKAYNVCPARVRNFEGFVSAFKYDHGYISGDTFFYKGACLNGYQPKKSDSVKVTAIESSQRKCEWRAVSIVPLSSVSDSYRSKQFQQASRQENGSWLVPGQRPKSFTQKVVLPVKLPHFTVPENLQNYVLDGSELTDVVPQLTQDLSFHNYSRRMSTLLHLEEIQMQMDIREFDMDRVCLHPVGEFLALTVPGLAEGRPSVLIGDQIILSSPEDPEGPRYVGYVHELTATDVHLKFSPEFHSRYGGQDYNVQFTFSRTTLRRSHQSVSLAVQFLGSKVLFPDHIDLKKPQAILKNLAPATRSLACTPDSSSKNNSATQNNMSRVVQSEQNGQPESPVVRYSSQDVRSKLQPSPIQKSGLESSEESHLFNRSKSSSCSSEDAVAQLSPPHKEEYDKQLDVESHLNSKSKSDSHKRQTDRQLCFFNSRLNARQKSAVERILLGQARPIPYVIFGPPGTGKTITVVEAILQVLHRIPSSRILACTPSNSAADLIAERLHSSGQVTQTQMVRLNAFQRSTDSIPESILKYCRFSEDMQMISRFRVIVSTCTMAGSLYALGLSAGHFTHAFVDECGQATEPECLIPVGLISGADGQIVLAGDPKQLGPIVMSPFAKMYGMELTFLERLMMRKLYLRNATLFADDGGFDPLVGEDIREENSPSWFNPGETVQVVRYLQGVLKEGVSPDDVGIITPYRKQVEKIRLMIDRLLLPDVKVGSVEEFQGQERQVIIISTVRSNEKLINFDVRHTLGFLSNPKRFNVALTRAQALLIIVGNPVVLCQDPNWNLLIKYCIHSGGYTGCELSDIPVQDNHE